jgi:hypothetical protein
MAAHLGDVAAALVDGHLAERDRQRALGHLAGCRICRDEVAGQAHARSALARLGAAPAPAPAALQDRLLTIAGPRPDVVTRPLTAPVRPAGARPAPTFGRPGPRRPAAGSPARRVRGGARLRRGRVLIGGVSLLVLTMSATFALGGATTTSGGDPVTPPVERFVVEHVDVPGMPVHDPAVAAVLLSYGR